MDNNDISKLLRLKRYEQPPPEYFENFLAEFQVRQRAEVIHRPFFRIAWDRLCRFLAPPIMPRLAMAGSFAVAVIALSAKMAKADGRVSHDEVRVFRESFHVAQSGLAEVARVFDLARRSTAGLTLSTSATRAASNSSWA